MWGITSKAANAGATRKRSCSIGLGTARVIARGPVEHSVIEISGELDFTCSDDLIPAINSLERRVVEFDLSDLEFVDCAGVRALAEARISCGDGVDLVALSGLRQEVARMIDLVELEALRMVLS